MAATVRAAQVVEVETPHGPARAQLHECRGARAALVLGHGAGGGIAARDLVASTGAALAERVTVALVEQPYRVAGRRSPPAARQLDAAWIAVVERLQESEVAGLPLIVGGRSSGARVACRTAGAVEAIGVLCLAFPLVPPGRPARTHSRLPELKAVSAPILIVQGDRDPFGMPRSAPGRRVVRVRGDHSLRSDQEALGAAVAGWLADLLD
jgi:uncharacterized protein